MSGYIVKITIEYTHPPVWRRIILPNSITFYDLHRIIQTAFGWRDCHLHEFQTADGICISNPDTGMDGDELNEKTTTIDDFLAASWIRYIYDFGDDWRHKIVFEKEDPAYDKRYAGILKAKGDSFREDSRCDEDSCLPFSIEDTNTALERMTFKQAKPSKQQKKAAQRIQDTQSVSDTLELIHKLLKHTGQPDMTDYEILTGIFNGTLKAEKLLENVQSKVSAPDSQTASRAAQAAEEWYQFTDTSRRTGVFPDAYQLDVARSSKSAEDLMTNLNEKELSDFCKYSAVDQDVCSGNISKKKKISLILDTFRQYPECLNYIFSMEEYIWIRTWCFTPGTNIPLKDSTVVVDKLLHLGLADIHFQMENGTEVASLSTASDLESFFPAQKNRQLKKTYEAIDRARDTLLALLALYGVAEVEMLFEVYSDCFPACRTIDDFKRFVYWHLRVNDHVSSATDLSGINYIIQPDLDPQAAMQQFAEHHDLPYRIFSENDIDRMRQGLCAYYLEWEIHFMDLTGPCDLSMQEANQKVIRAFIKMQNGCPLDEFYADVRTNLNLPAQAGIEKKADLWMTVMGLMMETAMPLFHGHTRYEVMEEWSYEADELALFPDRKWKKPVKSTHIADMPPEIQIRLHNICQDPEPSGNKYDEILEELGCANYEIRYLLIHDLIADEKFDRAEVETKALYKETHDRDIKNLLKEIDQYRELALDAEEFEDELFGDDPFSGSLYGNNFFSEAPYGNSLFGSEPFGGEFQPRQRSNAPYRREQPKIGRNDPCPCGSGKKYKQCCGK